MPTIFEEMFDKYLEENPPYLKGTTDKLLLQEIESFVKTYKPKELQKVIAVQDDSCHWYIIPADDYGQFRSMLNDHHDKTADEEQFETTFSRYRTGGDLNLVQLYAKI